MRLYLDANAIIYAIEAVVPFHHAVVTRIAQAHADPAGAVCTSRLSRLECRMKPLRLADAQLLAKYDNFFVHPRLELVGVLDDIVESATIYAPATISKLPTPSISPQPSNCKPTPSSPVTRACPAALRLRSRFSNSPLPGPLRLRVCSE